MDLFDKKQIRPMMPQRIDAPFDDAYFVFEPKLDGARMIAYLDKNSTYLENRRLNAVLPMFPEFNVLHKYVGCKCILDGELVYINSDGKPEFRGFQVRNMTKSALAARQYPMSYVVFDILYADGVQLTDLPLTERKQILEKTVHEQENLSLVRHVDTKGKALFDLTEQLGFEGIVAKRKDSIYKIGKRTENWKKIKHLCDDDFFICGYVKNESGGIKDLLLCANEDGELRDEGFVYIGMNKPEEEIILRYAEENKLKKPLFDGKDQSAVWCRPGLICEVQYLEKTKDGNRRHAVFKGLKE